jgi:peroxiredoxin
MKTAWLIFLIIGIGTFTQESWGTCLVLGNQAPNFMVESGDNQKLTLDMIHGKVIVLFYESRHVIKKNFELKNKLTDLYREQPQNIKNEIVRLLVIDCYEACWPFTPIFKSKLIENSRNEGFTIYGDWNGKMFADYLMQRNESNFIIIDKKGIVRYTATGKIANAHFDKIKDLLLTLVGES